MLILVDNDVREDVAVFLEQRGHEVARVRKVLDEAATDQSVAAYADEIGATVVTGNHRHFRNLITRRPEQHRAMRRAGRISLTCEQRQGVARLELFIAILESEHDVAQLQGDRRIIVEVADQYLVIER